MSRELVSPQLQDAVRSLPSDAVKDLLSLGVCVRCTFRIFGIRGSVFLNPSLSPPVILSIIGEPTDTDNSTVREGLEDAGPEICPVCLGVLQFVFCDEKDTLVRMQGAEDFAASVFGMVKKEGHSIDGFSLEVSLPQIISDNEQGVRSYMKSKYDSQHWFKQMLSVFMSTKDALKFMITTSLETLLDVKSGPGSICIRLTYSQAKPSTMVPTSKRNGSCKRLKTGNNNDLSSVNDDLVGASSESVSLSAAERHVICQESSSGLEACEIFQCFRFPAEKTNEPCHLALLCCRSPVYFVGRYLKFSRNVSQTRWMIDDERMGEASVEEIIGGNILPICRGDGYKFHAAGREDIDVRMLGSGRPFLVEIQNPRQVLTEDAIKEIETKINNLENKLVGVKNLKVASSEGWTLMHEGEAEKQKQYCALVWISRPLEDQDLLSITSFKDMLVSQKTPIRVLHRRSPLEREKTIHWMKIEKIAGSSQYFLLHLCTQAGTYIKEFVHGDLGRTHPCIGSILGCRAEILQLDVTDVKMDCFPPE